MRMAHQVYRFLLGAVALLSLTTASCAPSPTTTLTPTSVLTSTPTPLPTRTLDATLTKTPPPKRRGPVIVNASPSGKPGDIIGLQGDFNSSAHFYLTLGSSRRTKLDAVNKRDGYAAIKIPKSFSFGLDGITVADERGESPPVYVNRARAMSFDTPEVAAGSAFRIFGRNLLLAGATPSVRFVDTVSGKSLGAAVMQRGSDAYVLKVAAPAGVKPGITYDVYVDNGFGGANGESKAEESLLGRKGGVDHFGLGVPWASDYDFFNNVYNVKTDPRLSQHAAGDSVNNDQPAIQQAINAASAAGGGIVYLPAGTYKIPGADGFEMANRVVIQGAGKASTFIKYGYGTPVLSDPSNPALQRGGYILDWPNGVFQSGLADLSVINVNESGTWYNSVAHLGKASELFLARISFDQSTSDQIYMGGIRKFVVKDSVFKQAYSTYHEHGPWAFGGNSYLIIQGVTTTKFVGAYVLDDVDHGVIEGNHFIRDASADRYSGGSRIITVNFSDKIAILQNTFEVINGVLDVNNNNGETINSEGGGIYRRNQNIGTVTSATSLSLQDTDKNWSSTSFSHPDELIVAIVSGNGAGQWRKVTKVSSNTLTVDEPWTIVPAAGSHYSTFSWSGSSWIIKENTLKDNAAGILLYEGSYRDIAIVNNRLLNNRGIYLNPVWRIDREEFTLHKSIQVIGNTVTNADGLKPAYIGVAGADVDYPKAFGIQAIGVEIRNNTINAHVPNTHEPPDSERFTEGFYNKVNYQYSSPFVDEGIPVLLGTIFQGNVAHNCENAFYLNADAYNTTIWNTKTTGGGALINDDQMSQGLAHASVGTIVGP